MPRPDVWKARAEVNLEVAVPLEQTDPCPAELVTGWRGVGKSKKPRDKMVAMRSNKTSYQAPKATDVT